MVKRITSNDIWTIYAEVDEPADVFDHPGSWDVGNRRGGTVLSDLPGTAGIKTGARRQLKKTDFAQDLRNGVYLLVCGIASSAQHSDTQSD